MKRINALICFLTISSLYSSFGEVHYYSIDSLSILSAVDLDSNKIINLRGRVQDEYPFDSNSTNYDSNFTGDFAFSTGILDPGCGGQLFLTFYPSYHVPDLNKIDTSNLLKRPRLDSLHYRSWPLYEIDNFYINSLPIDPINEFYLIETNNNHFALLRIKAFIYSYFDPSSLCYMKNAIKIEWWIQDDGNYNQLGQIVDIIYKNNSGINHNILTFNNLIIYDLMGRKCVTPISSGLSIIKNQNNKNDENNHFYHFHGYQK